MSEGVLGDFLSFRNGKTSPDRANDAPYPVYGSNGIVGHSYETNVSQPCVVIGRVGSYCGSTYYASTPAWVTDNAMVALPEDVVEAQFWFYALKSKRLNEYRQGSGQPLLNQTILRSIPFEAPEPMARRQIAATLGALDDKIDSNRRLISQLQELGAAHFDQGLISGSFSVELRDVASHKPGKYLAKGDYEEGAVVVYGSNSIMGTHNEALYEGPLMVMARIGSYCGAFRWSESSAWVNNNASAVIANSGQDPWVLRWALEHHNMEPFKAGTGQPYIAVKPFMASRIELPIAVGDLGPALKVLSRREARLQVENRKLAALRDALLPELLSGRIRVPEAQETVLEATGN